MRFSEDGLRLVGPSKESYELKQRLLGRPIDQSGARGRPVDQSGARGRPVDQSGARGRPVDQSGARGRSVSRRSGSLPPTGSRTPGRDGGAAAGPPAGGFSPSLDDGRRGGASAAPDRSGAARRRSASECRGKKETVKVDEKEANRPTRKLALKAFPQLTKKSVKESLQKLRK